MEPVERSDALEKSYLDLLNVLPHPTALFKAADGSLLAVNRLFCEALALPEKETDQIVGKWHGGAEKSHSPLIVRDTEGDAIHFQSPAGIHVLTGGTARPLQFNGLACELLSVAANRQPASDDEDLEIVRYRTLLENLNEIIYVNDRNAVIQYVSANIYRLSGYHAHEVIGRSFTEFVHPEDLEGRIETFIKILAGEEQATEYRMISKTGEMKWIRTDARPIIRDGEVVGIQGALVDVTDLKEVEAALRRSEEKYRSVVQNSKDAIVVLQGDFIKYVNPSASKILGAAIAGLANTPFWEHVHPEDRKILKQRYDMRLRGESYSDHAVFRILNREGDIRDVDLNAVSITWEEKPAVLILFRDITIQKRMENHLRNAQKMQALGTLSGGIAHNFNNLLMGIHGNASLSLADLPPSAAAHSHLNKIINLVQSGSKLTRQLLEYARGRACEIGTVNINELVKDAAETLTATKKQIQIQFNLCDELPCIKADQGQIEQAVLNMLLNSADAMPEGGEVQIETAWLTDDQIVGKMNLAQNMDYVMIKITDCGTGIPEEILDRIFEPFFTTKGLGRGTGLGLSTAYGIIKNHDGDIFAQSQVGEGTALSIYLPVVLSEDIDPTFAPPPARIEGHGTILLVDDEPFVLEPSAKLLGKMGFHIFTATDGMAALEIFQRERENIDLVILDLIMPNMSGKELYYKIKEISPKTKVLLSSGYNEDGHAEELLEAGCVGFIQKPYDVTDLSARLMEIISAPRQGTH